MEESNIKPVTHRQIAYIAGLCEMLGLSAQEIKWQELNRKTASELITSLKTSLPANQ